LLMRASFERSYQVGSLVSPPPPIVSGQASLVSDITIVVNSSLNLKGASALTNSYTLSSLGRVNIIGGLSAQLVDFTLTSAGTRNLGGVSVLNNQYTLSSVGGRILAGTSNLSIDALLSGNARLLVSLQSNLLGNITLSSVGKLYIDGRGNISLPITLVPNGSRKLGGVVSPTIVLDMTAGGVLISEYVINKATFRLNAKQVFTWIQNDS
jgi:hypothetical protein